MTSDIGREEVFSPLGNLDMTGVGEMPCVKCSERKNADVPIQETMGEAVSDSQSSSQDTRDVTCHVRIPVTSHTPGDGDECSQAEARTEVKITVKQKRGKTRGKVSNVAARKQASRARQEARGIKGFNADLPTDRHKLVKNITDKVNELHDQEDVVELDSLAARLEEALRGEMSSPVKEAVTSHGGKATGQPTEKSRTQEEKDHSAPGATEEALRQAHRQNEELCVQLRSMKIVAVFTSLFAFVVGAVGAFTQAAPDPQVYSDSSTSNAVVTATPARLPANPQATVSDAEVRMLSRHKAAYKDFLLAPTKQARFGAEVAYAEFVGAYKAYTEYASAVSASRPTSTHATPSVATTAATQAR